MLNKGKVKQLNENQRMEIIAKLNDPKPRSKRALAREYEVSEATIRNTWENREIIHKRCALLTQEARQNIFRASGGRFTEIEDMLYIWIDSMRRAKLSVSPP